MIHESAIIGADAFSYRRLSNGNHIKNNNSDFPTAIHESVDIGPLCVIDRGTYRNTRIGQGTIIDSNVKIAHDVVIGEECEIDTGAIILGEVTIGNNVRICTGAIVHPKVKIGKNCVLGAGSYLRHNMGDNTIFYGSPAEEKKNTNYGDYLKNL